MSEVVLPAYSRYVSAPPQDTALQAPPGYVTPKWPGLYAPTWSVRRSNGNGTDVLPGNYLFEAIGESCSDFTCLPAHPAHLSDIWHYTLYWHLVFHSLIFCLPALWFTLVLLLSPTSSLSLRVRSKKNVEDNQSMELTSIRNDTRLQQEEETDPTGGPPEKKPTRSGVVGITSTGETIQLSSVQTHVTESSSDTGVGEYSERWEGTSSRTSIPSSSNQNKARPRKSAPLYLAFLPFIFLTLWGVASALIMSTIIGFVLAAVYNTTGFEMATCVILVE